jgi:plastocyanin
MKKTLLILTAVLSLGTCFAKRHNIKVSNFQFSPATTNAHVGDTIFFIWVNGGHTTTSLTIPAKAKPWDTAMDMTHKRFRYIVKQAGTYNFECAIHTFMTGKINVTLPAVTADLSDVDISTDNSNAVLNWQATNSSDVAYFSVQRSTDGNNFTEIARVQPSASNVYTFKDEAALTDKYVYYQVELTDKKGNTQLSDISMFTNSNNSAKLITSISPNPVSSPGHLMLQFNADADGKMKVQLYTQSGKLVTETEMTAVKGLNNGHMHLGDLTPGTYYIVFTLGNKTEKHIVVYQ